MTKGQWFLLWLAAVYSLAKLDRWMWKGWREARRKAGIKWWQIWM